MLEYTFINNIIIDHWLNSCSNLATTNKFNRFVIYTNMNTFIVDKHRFYFLAMKVYLIYIYLQVTGLLFVEKWLVLQYFVYT